MRFQLAVKVKSDAQMHHVCRTAKTHGGRASFVSLWRYLSVAIVALLMMLESCGAVEARPFPPPRHILVQKSIEAAVAARKAAIPASSAEHLQQRAHEDLNSIHVSSAPNTSYVWEVVTPTKNLTASVACSDSGQYVVSGGFGSLYTSSDYGVSWKVSTAYLIRDVAISSSGQYVAAAVHNEGIYISSDYGTSWNMVVPENSGSPFWYAIATSDDGQFLAAASFFGFIHTSNDYGVTWQVTTAGPNEWCRIQSSASGQYLAAITFSNGVFISSDYGGTWINILKQDHLSRFTSATLSNNGQYIAATGGGDLYTSNSYGSTWSVSPFLGLVFITSNGNGNYLAGRAYGVYSSSNYGATWELVSQEGLSLYDAAVSSDGHYMYGCNEEGIHKLTRNLDPPVASLTASPSLSPTFPPSIGCLNGTYNTQPGQSNSLCAVCPAGTYSTEGMNACATCPAGTYSGAWSSSCTQCPAGFYCLPGATTAVMCPAGTVSQAGASSCTPCANGEYSYPGSSSCLTCASA